MNQTPHHASTASIIAIVVVAALGYFVDIYDLILFSVVRIKSLKDLGVTDVTNVGMSLISWQMWGMLIGGLLWGIWGDKRGRLSVLFGSILLYSVANIVNGYVGQFGFGDSVAQYKILRFIAGIGLAGELGAGITLVNEVMSKEFRGYGVTVVATVGLTGAIAAYWVNATFDWRTAYLVGGCLGLLLLVLRISVAESGMFRHAEQASVSRGNLLMLLQNSQRAWRYLCCILIGLPTWFVIGILASFSPEFGKAFGMTEPIEAGKVVMWAYVGLVLGDLMSGVLSQWLQSRKKVMLLFHTLSLFSIVYFLSSGSISLQSLYFKAVLLGLGVGYWAIFVTIASEQFGTNVRALVTTTVPNFVRGALPLITLLFQFFRDTQGVIAAGFMVGGITLAIAMTALYFVPETFGKDLNYIEQ